MSIFKLNFSFKNLTKNTPQWIKHIANSLVIACSFAAGFSFADRYPWVSLSIGITAFIAKFVSECFVDHPNDNNNANS